MDYADLYRPLAAAAVRGWAAQSREQALPQPLAEKPLEALSDRELEAILDLGSAWGVKLYRFKRGHASLPRVRRVLGFLQAVRPESLLDVGSGRGVFLFPFLDAFPGVPVTCLDVLDHRVSFLQSLRLGGLGTLTAVRADICTKPVPARSADVVTMLEVLEHIPDVQAAVSAAAAIARRYVVVTVPSGPDNNPEHIHLLTKERLRLLFGAAGCARLQFGGVPGHLVMIAAVSKES